MLQIALLGGTGFVGSAVLRTAAGAARCLLRAGREIAPAPNRIVVRGALPEVPRDFFPKAPYVLLHFATKQRDLDGTGFQRINVGGTRQVMQSLDDRCRGIIYGSSMSVYGPPSSSPAAEGAPIRPATPLAHSRAEAEDVILRFASERKIHAYILRPRFIIGQGDRFIVPTMANSLARRLQLGADTTRYSIIDVDDYAKVVAWLVQRIASTTVEQLAYNVAYTRPIALSDATTILGRTLGLPPPLIRIGNPGVISSALSSVPTRLTQAWAERLALMANSQCMDIGRLRTAMGTGIVTQQPEDVFYRAACAYAENPHGASTGP
ncbi:NAD(P)-dependent oxidoreductase [Pendulispora brunnea]|uniref:NAD(P)-dependent oxidoreductase n=1 Tax=Pendulispora brunnea TaxID=2905690 RepID=A0ABZ2KCT6_9BACT